MQKVDAAAWGCCNLITSVLLLIFTAVATGTYSWGVAIYEIENTVTGCSVDIDWYIGLQQQYRSYDFECTDDGDSDLSDMDCENLTDHQCDLLNEARDTSAVAVTSCVLLIILFGMVMLGVNKPKGNAMYALVVVAFVTGVVMLSTAFAATTAYESLISTFSYL